MNLRNSILFLSHHVRHTRNKYLLEYLSKISQATLPSHALSSSSTLSMNLNSASSMLYLGLSGMGWDKTVHLDGIDIFIHPFIRNRPYLHDYHVPLVPELKWNRLSPLAKIAHSLLPESLAKAKVVIAPNQQMLEHASEYARLPDSFLVPNYPPKKFFVDISISKARESIGIKENDTIALFIGGARLREVYGIELLIKTWIEVRKKKHDARLCILGPYEHLGFPVDTLRRMEEKGISFVGRVDHTSIPSWISASDLCLSQRTPGFPMEFYNIHDSLKLSEYALFKKPIVAAGYSVGEDYISTKTTVESYKAGIIDALDGNAPVPTPHTWEECIPELKKAYDILLTFSKES